MVTDGQTMARIIRNHFIRLDESIGETSLPLEKLNTLSNLGKAYA